MFSRFIFIYFFLFFPFFINAEELTRCFRDAYNYYPDVKKSKKELDISKKDLQISKTDFLPSLDFSASSGKY